jgi:hypothetical protein
MTSTCPSKQDWLNLVDGEVTENHAAELRAHASQCSDCGRALEWQRQLLSDLAAPVPVSGDAVEKVLRRLDDAGPRPAQRWRWRGWAWGACGLAAACAAILVVPMLRNDQGQFSARGQRVPWQQKVGAEVWALDSSPRKLEPGATITPRTALVARYHNVDASEAFLLVFASDVRGEIHWVYPGWGDARTDPEAIRLEALQMQKVLAESVMLDDLPAGPVDIITMITREPWRVSRIESLPRAERDVASLRRRFPSAHIDGLPLRVVAVPAAAKDKP